jgi:hypothetical protein
MKAISIRQPWAWAILHAGKDIENRDWPTRFRGTVAIHAAKGMERYEYNEFCELQANIFAAGFGSDVIVPAFDSLPRGSIVGVVDIVDCVTRSGSPWFFGEYGFVLANSRALVEPVPCRGALSF